MIRLVLLKLLCVVIFLTVAVIILFLALGGLYIISNRTAMNSIMYWPFFSLSFDLDNIYLGLLIGAFGFLRLIITIFGWFLAMIWLGTGSGLLIEYFSDRSYNGNERLSNA